MSATFYLSASCLSLHPLPPCHPFCDPSLLHYTPSCMSHNILATVSLCFFRNIYHSLEFISSLPLRFFSHSLPLPSTNHGLLPHFTPSCKAHSLLTAIEHFFEQYISLPKFISSLPPSKVEKYTPHPLPSTTHGSSTLLDVLI